MQSRPFPSALVALILAIAGVNALAQEHSWYWTMRWFDMPMHFAGGVWLAGAALWFRFFSGRFQTASTTFNSLALWGVGASFGVGFAWEVYEGIVSLIMRGHLNAMPDTLGDLAFAILGGLVVSLVVYVKLKNQNAK